MIFDALDMFQARLPPDRPLRTPLRVKGMSDPSAPVSAPMKGSKKAGSGPLRDPKGCQEGPNQAPSKEGETAASKTLTLCPQKEVHYLHQCLKIRVWNRRW